MNFFALQECLKNEEIEEQLALFLLCGVSNVVTDGSNVDLETEDIYQLCYVCCEALKLENLTSNKYKFLCSLYHITKYLLSKVKTLLTIHSATVYFIKNVPFLYFRGYVCNISCISQVRSMHTCNLYYSYL